ncbi:hypothetical protein HHK36_014786 [Tetracentron sinense]|uniref:Uncharacterized protein n=1 Tax=Tetracentron sinense TaxID=13715 RepID=A0A834Z510_TETSI|nr:hypothetical protein HHK36_014786 [Tetracentron sinense]
MWRGATTYRPSLYYERRRWALQLRQKLRLSGATSGFFSVSSLDYITVQDFNLTSSLQIYVEAQACKNYWKFELDLRAAANATKAIIDEEIAENLNIEQLFSIAVVEHKYRFEGLDSTIPEFQVFFRDQTSNDFNTLFTTLPLDRRYFIPKLVSGGLLALIMPSFPNGTPLSQSFLGIQIDLMGSTLMDMAKMGLVSEAKVDSFNLPIYLTSPQELEGLVERNGCFSIMKLYLADSSMKHKAQSVTIHARAGMEGLVREHFGSEIIDELFNQYCAKLEEYSFIFDSDYLKENQLFVILKRK